MSGPDQFLDPRRGWPVPGVDRREHVGVDGRARVIAGAVGTVEGTEGVGGQDSEGLVRHLASLPRLATPGTADHSGTIVTVPYFIMILVAVAALAVLVGVVFVVLGKGGQLARFEADFPPLDLPEDRPVGSHDLGGLLLPLALWGYHVRAVDALLLRLTATLREREERIEDLEWRLARLDPSYVPQGTGPSPDSYLPGDTTPGTFGQTAEDGAPEGAVDGGSEGAPKPSSESPESGSVESVGPSGASETGEGAVESTGPDAHESEKGTDAVSRSGERSAATPDPEA